MLSKLTIKNVALIEHATLDFGGGLNVLSGETGAGKSVILDSVNFVLGAKAERSMIRYGEAECMVKAEFIVDEQSSAVKILREMDIDSDGEIIISRKFTAEGKNAIKVNGNTVTAAMLRKVTDCLVDVHGQSEHFYLLKESNQLKMLDDVIGEPVRVQKLTLKDLLTGRRELTEQMNMLGGDEKERKRRLDVLQFQIEEIQAVNLQEGEEEELLSKRNKMANLEKIMTALHEASHALSGEYGALDCLRAAKRSLTSISALDTEYADVCEKAESVAIDTEDVAETISQLADSLYFDENEANAIEERLDVIRGLKRKYGANKQEIDAYFENIQHEYELLADCEGKREVLTQELSKLQSKIYTICQELTALRKSYGKAFCKRVTDELKTLNIASAQFDISFNDYEKADADRAGSNGLDDIYFLFSANAGEPMKPLGKIISGGEMSRLMLAIKTQLSSINEISTYIFDEIDAGISGVTAKVVAEKLAKIAKNTQIIAVSHLAQIAAMSDNEFLIEKQEEDGKTHTNVFALDFEGKKCEIVRLLGGGQEGGFALRHAEELLQQAETYKKSI